MSDFTTIQVLRNGPLATVTLSRPDVRNAMNPTMIGELTDAFSALTEDPAIRVIALGGDGGTFCAGGDLNWMADVLGQTEEEVVADSRRLLDMYRAINDCPKTVIVRIHGAAFAGALGLVACADIAIAEADSKFCVSEVRIGLVAGVIAAFVIPRIGPGWFRYLATSATVFDALAARDAGLVHVVAPDREALDAEVKRHVSLALETAPEAVAETGRLIGALGYKPDEEMFSTGLLFNAKARLSDTAQTGIRSFLGKTRPPWAVSRES